jgi:uncharacterized membrane protein
MYANFLNVVLGLALVYSAVLRPSLVAARPQLLFVVAGCILVLAWLARRSDHHPWQNNVNMLLGVLLAVMVVLQLRHFPVATFWTQFSVGSSVAVLALWAALYRPEKAAS